MPRDHPSSAAIQRDRHAYRQGKCAQKTAQFLQPEQIPPAFPPTQFQRHRSCRPTQSTTDNYNKAGGQADVKDRAARANILTPVKEGERPKKRPIPPFSDCSPDTKKKFAMNCTTQLASPEFTNVDSPAPAKTNFETPTSLKRNGLSEPESEGKKRFCQSPNLEEVRKSNAVLKKKLNDAQLEISELNEEKKVLSDKNRQMEKDGTLLRNKVNELECKCKKLEDSEDLHMKLVKSLEQEVKTANAKVQEEFVRAKEEIKERYVKRTKELYNPLVENEKKLKKEIDDLKLQLVEEKSRPNLTNETLNAEISKLTDSVQILMEEKAKQSEELSKANNSVEGLQQKLAAQYKLSVEYEQLIKDCNEKTKDQIVRLDEKVAELHQMDTQREALIKENEDLKELNKSVATKAYVINLKGKEMEVEYQKLKQQINQLTMINYNLQNELNEKNKRLSTIEKAFNSPAQANKARANSRNAVAVMPQQAVPMAYSPNQQYQQYQQQIPYMQQMAMHQIAGYPFPANQMHVNQFQMQQMSMQPNQLAIPQMQPNQMPIQNTTYTTNQLNIIKK